VRIIFLIKLKRIEKKMWKDRIREQQTTRYYVNLRHVLSRRKSVIILPVLIDKWNFDFENVLKHLFLPLETHWKYQFVARRRSSSAIYLNYVSFEISVQRIYAIKLKRSLIFYFMIAHVIDEICICKISRLVSYKYILFT
jgi:hypothetical protein